MARSATLPAPGIRGIVRPTDRPPIESGARQGRCRMLVTAVAESHPGSAGAAKPRLLDRVRQELRSRHFSPRTEEAYVAWVRRFILHHGKRHPAEMGEAEITRFLSNLAVDRHVSPSTQNQALAALLFLYRDVLHRQLPWLEGVVRA